MALSRPRVLETMYLNAHNFLWSCIENDIWEPSVWIGFEEEEPSLLLQ